MDLKEQIEKRMAELWDEQQYLETAMAFKYMPMRKGNGAVHISFDIDGERTVCGKRQRTKAGSGCICVQIAGIA